MTTEESAVRNTEGVFKPLGEESWYFMFTEVFRYRELILQMVIRDLRVRYKQTIMGFAWALFKPMIMILSGCLVKFVMAQVSNSTLDVMGIAGMMIKSIAWGYFVGGVGAGSGCLVGNLNLVSKIYFPREVFFFNNVLSQGFDIVVSLFGLAAIFLWMGIFPTIHILWIPFLSLVLICMVMAIGMILSYANVFYRDVSFIVGIVLSFGIFYAPVYYEPEIFGPVGSKIMMLNPAAPVLEGIRLTTVGLPKAMLTEEYQNQAREVAAHPQQNKQNVGEYMREQGKLATGKPQDYQTISLMRTLYHGNGTLLWSPYYLLYASLISFVGLFYAWRRFHFYEFIIPEYL